MAPAQARGRSPRPGQDEGSERRSTAAGRGPDAGSCRPSPEGSVRAIRDSTPFAMAAGPNRQRAPDCEFKAAKKRLYDKGHTRADGSSLADRSRVCADRKGGTRQEGCP